MCQGLNHFCITHENDIYLLTRKSFPTITEALKEAKKQCDTIKKQVFVYKRNEKGYVQMATVEYQKTDVLLPLFMQSNEESVMTKNTKIDV